MLTSHPSVFVHSPFSHFYCCLFQNYRDVWRSYFLVCLLLLSSSSLVLNVCDSLSEFPSIGWPLFKIQRPKVKMPLQIQNISHAEALFSFALVRGELFVHSPSDSCTSVPVSSWQCLYDEASTFTKPSWSLLLCFPLTMCVSACLSPDVFVSIFPVESHPAISCSYC